MRYPAQRQNEMELCGNGGTGGLQIWRSGDKDSLFTTDQLEMATTDITVWNESEEGNWSGGR